MRLLTLLLTFCLNTAHASHELGLEGDIPPDLLELHMAELHEEEMEAYLIEGNFTVCYEGATVRFPDTPAARQALAQGHQPPLAECWIPSEHILVNATLPSNPANDFSFTHHIPTVDVNGVIRESSITWTKIPNPEAIDGEPELNQYWRLKLSMPLDAEDTFKLELQIGSEPNEITEDMVGLNTIFQNEDPEAPEIFAQIGTLNLIWLISEDVAEVQVNEAIANGGPKGHVDQEDLVEIPWGDVLDLIED